MAFSKASTDVRSILSTPPTYHALPTGQHKPISQWAYLGSIGPDFPGSYKGVEWIFEVLHWKKSNSFVASWIQNMEPLEPGETVAMNLAFLFGFLSHMAVDSILHPYVNTFAGVLDKQSIPVAAKKGFIPLPIIGYPLDHILGTPMKASMHRFVEVHQDSHIAKKYYGAKSLSGQAGGDSWSASWSDFIDAVTSDSYKAQFNVLINRYEAAMKETYPDGKNPDFSGLKKAEKRVKLLALDMGYDWGLGYLPDHPEEIFVQHPKRDRPYESYLWSAADTTVKYWEAARTFYYSPKALEDRKEFFRVVRNFNLDTGLAPRVYSNPWKIYIRHESSWNLFLDKPKPFDPEMPPD
jgi:hypothetical protein